MIDDYITDVLLRDLVGHDRRPVSFLVYLWLTAEQARRGAAVQISYRELAENIGISKSSLHGPHSLESSRTSQIHPRANVRNLSEELASASYFFAGGCSVLFIAARLPAVIAVRNCA